MRIGSAIFIGYYVRKKEITFKRNAIQKEVPLPSLSVDARELTLVRSCVSGKDEGELRKAIKKISGEMMKKYQKDHCLNKPVHLEEQTTHRR